VTHSTSSPDAVAVVTARLPCSLSRSETIYVLDGRTDGQSCQYSAPVVSDVRYKVQQIAYARDCDSCSLRHMKSWLTTERSGRGRGL